MRFAPIACLLVILVAFASASVFKASEYSSLFAKFTQNFKRAYKQSEVSEKLNIFKANLDKITLANTKSPGSLHVNGLADMSTRQYRSMLLLKAPQSLYVAMQKIRGGANRNGGNTALALLESETNVNAPVDQAAVDAVDAYASFLETTADAEVGSERRRKKEEEEKARQDARKKAEEDRAAAEAKRVADEKAKKEKDAADLIAFADAGFDWRSKKVNTEPRHQGGCGSCWSYATIAVVEAAITIKHKISPPVLSEQHLVDCDSGNFGCNGGWYTNAFKHVAAKGARTTSAYGPYKLRKEACREDSVAAYEHKITGGSNIFSYTHVRAKEDYQLQLIASLKSSPVAIAIHSSDVLQFWGKKIYTPSNCNYLTDVNHAVVAVGTGKGPEGPYWIIRNSWGKSWGDGTGHFKMERHPTDNTCGYQVGAFVATI